MTRSTRGVAGTLLTVSLHAALIVGMASVAAQAEPTVRALGLENPNKVMTITVSLNLRNQAALNALTKQIQTKGSPQYHKFLTMAQFAGQYAPTAAASLAVKNFLTSQGMTVTYVDKYNMVVRAKGTVADIQKAFNTQVGLFESGGQQFDRPLTTPTIAGALGNAVRNVGGLTTLKARSHVMRPVNIKTGQPVPPKPITAAALKSIKNGLFFSFRLFSAVGLPYTSSALGLRPYIAATAIRELAAATIRPRFSTPTVSILSSIPVSTAPARRSSSWMPTVPTRSYRILPPSMPYMD